MMAEKKRLETELDKVRRVSSVSRHEYHYREKFLICMPIK